MPEAVLSVAKVSVMRREVKLHERSREIIRNTRLDTMFLTFW